MITMAVYLMMPRGVDVQRNIVDETDKKKLLAFLRELLIRFTKSSERDN